MSHLIGITDMLSMTFQVGTIFLENLEAILAITFCNGFHYCHYCQYFNNTFIIAVEKFNGIQLLDPLYKTCFFLTEVSSLFPGALKSHNGVPQLLCSVLTI